MREVMDVQIERYSKPVTVAVVAGQADVHAGSTHCLFELACSLPGKISQPWAKQAKSG